MTTQIAWTTNMIKDVAMALSTSLGRVPENSIENTAIAENWHKVEQWLAQANRILGQDEDESVLDQIPPFPLTGQELRALQASIDRIAQARAVASADDEGTTSAHLHSSLTQTVNSSRGVVFALGVLSLWLLASVVSLFVLQGLHTWEVLSLSVSLVLIAAAGIELLRYHRNLITHQNLLYNAHPAPGV